MATKDFVFKGIDMFAFVQLVGAAPAASTTFGPVQYGILPLLNNLNARMSVTYDPAQVPHSDVDFFMSQCGWVPA